MSQAEAIIAAVRARDVERVRELLDADPSLVNTPTDDGGLVLTALYHGARSVLQELLARRPVLDVFAAAAVGDTARLQELLAADPGLLQAETREGFTLLGLAAFFGQTAAVRLLLDAGAPVGALSHSRVPYVPRNTALHAAIAGGPHLGTAALLLQRGADPCIFDSAHHTPLHTAAFRGDVAAAELLISHGADVNARRSGGPTALAIARERGHTAFVELLRRHGARE